MKLAALLACVALSGCGASDGSVFTLYRTSALDTQMRLHVATFDANESAEYNSENCNTAMRLFQSQAGVTVRFWCEKGRFRR